MTETAGTYNVSITISSASPSVSSSDKVLVLAQGATKTLAYGLGTCIPYTPPTPSFQIVLDAGSESGKTKITSASMPLGESEYAFYNIGGYVDAPLSASGIVGMTLDYSQSTPRLLNAPLEGGGTLSSTLCYDYEPGADIPVEGDDIELAAGYTVTGIVTDSNGQILRASNAEITAQDLAT